MKQRKEYIKMLINYILVIGIMILILPQVIASTYTVLVADDFAHGVKVGVFHVNFVKYLCKSAEFMMDRYLNWQGTYFSMFIQAFLSPINNFGLPQLRVIMIFNSILFWGV